LLTDTGMKIALIGYGKMGKAIEQIAVSRGHEIVLRITSSNRHEMSPQALQQADVAIEFTGPDAAAANVMECLDAGVSVVTGSTGWNNELPAACSRAVQQGVALLHASNFSIGVNIFFEVNKLLASLMKGRADYTPTVIETHHIHKKDKPGGTAITLTEQIMQQVGHTGWSLDGEDNSPGTIPVYAHRVGEVPGTHSIKWSSSIDDIEITHTAHSREGFALGAVLAAEFVSGRIGVFSMQDVLGIVR